MTNIKHAVFRIKTARMVSLLVFFLIFNTALFGLEPMPLLLPMLQSLGTPQKTVGDAFAALQYMLYEAIFPWLPIASFLIVSVLLGKLLCGWVCPFGFVQEILGLLKRSHMTISARTHREMLYAKYLILGVVLFVSVTISASTAAGAGGGYKDALGIFAQAPFNAVSPHDTLFAVLPIMTYNAFSAEAPFQDVLGAISTLSPLFWIRLFVLGGVLVFAFYTPRSFCSYFCPVGAAMGLLNHFSFLGLKRDVVQCTKEGCRSCVEVCPMKVPILDLPWEKFTHSECTYCLDCVDACTPNAIKPKIF